MVNVSLAPTDGGWCENSEFPQMLPKNFAVTHPQVGSTSFSGAKSHSKSLLNEFKNFMLSTQTCFARKTVNPFAPIGTSGAATHFQEFKLEHFLAIIILVFT